MWEIRAKCFLGASEETCRNSFGLRQLLFDRVQIPPPPPNKYSIILWVGNFSLERGRNIASDEIDSFVTKTAKLLGCINDDLESAVKFLEKKFPIPSDRNTPDFGGGLQQTD